MKKALILFLAMLIAAGCTTALPENNPAQHNSLYRIPLTVGEKRIEVEVVSSNEAMAKGLSGRQPLTDEQGMLFDFGGPTTPAFWMPDMTFDIDIVWINNNRIIGITKNVPAPKAGHTSKDTQNLPRYFPPAPVNMVLEVSSGWADRWNVHEGDLIMTEQAK